MRILWPSANVDDPGFDRFRYQDWFSSSESPAQFREHLVTVCHSLPQGVHGSRNLKFNLQVAGVQARQAHHPVRQRNLNVDDPPVSRLYLNIRL
jgi:hypothetical protein